MLDTLTAELNDYFAKWEAVTSDVDLPALRSDAVGWKVADAAEYQKLYLELREHCDKTVETWMNGRWIAKLHLKDQELPDGIRLIKLMQRRPGSDDALGLDHVDFIGSDMAGVETMLQASTLQWSTETNDVIDNYSWLSVWFEGTEAKIKDHSVIDIIVRELQELK
jgi:hypothetical protein